MYHAIKFRAAALIAKPDAERIGETLKVLYHHLEERGVTVVVENESRRFLKDVDPQTANIPALAERCDFAIVIGGDGTFLSAARAFAPFDIPLVGVNLGRLGFLVDISPQHLTQRIDEILQGRFVEERRLLLGASLIRGEKVIFQQLAINDVVVHRSNASSMIEIMTHIDGVFLNSQRSDGLIVSTPTGSTAYALSAGGPILSPSLRALVLAPINPHTLTNRPIVVDSESVVEISFQAGRPFGAQLVCDNVSSPALKAGDKVEIRKDSKSFRILHPEGYDFFEILRAKLNWSSGLRV